MGLQFDNGKLFTLELPMDSTASIKKATGRSTPWLILLRIGIRSTDALRQGRIETSPES
jgi:hypothetical protein